MDTETLVQKLFEFQTLLDGLRHEFESSTTSDAPGPQQESQMLRQLLSTGHSMLDESARQLLLLQKILRNNPAGIAVVSGPDLIFRMATATYTSMLPASNNLDVVGLPYRDVWPQDEKNRSEKLIRQIFNSGKNMLFDRIEQRYPDGLLHYFSMRICLMDWHGEPGALILLQETTQADRARHLAMEIAEEAHRQAEELDAIISAMAEAVMIFNAGGTVIRANPAAIELYDLDPIELSQNEIIELLSIRRIDGSPIPVEEMASERALNGETVIGQYLLMHDQGGQEHIIRASASPLFNDNELTAVVAIWHDVTERERLLEQIEIEQSRLETIIKHAPEAILVADEEGRMVFANPAAARIFDRELPIQNSVDSLQMLNLCYEDGHPYEPRYLPLTCSALDGEAFSNVEMLSILPDGDTRYILMSTAPIVDRKGNLNGAVGVIQDITQRKQAEEALRRQASRSQLMATLSRGFAEARLNYRELLDTIVGQIGQFFGDLCILYLTAEDSDWYIPAAVYQKDDEAGVHSIHMADEPNLFTQQNLAEPVFQIGKAAVFTDIPAGQVQASFAPAALPVPTAGTPVNALIIPLRAHGRNVGALYIVRTQIGNHFSVEDQTFLQDLGDRAALAIEDARLYESEAQRARELDALNRAATALRSTIDLEMLLAQIMNAAQLAIPAASYGVLYLAGENHALEIRAALGSMDFNAMNVELDHQAARVTNEKRPVILERITILPGVDGELPPTCSAIITPLMLADREKDEQRVLGVLVLFGTQPKLFTRNDLHLLDGFAATATAALQNATLYAEVKRLATTDSVTGQYNRGRFFELGELEMHRFRRFQTPLSAIMLDLDNFKHINDTYGHGAGDQVLRTVAERCHLSIRVVDILGRYGGDEFCIMLPNADQEEAAEIAERIRQMVIASPVHTDKGDVAVSLSLGIAQAQGATESLSSLLGRADDALYLAKQSGRNRVMQD